MSWSITVSPKPHDIALKDLDDASEQAKAQHPDSSDQIDLAVDTVHIMISEEGVFGTAHEHDYAIGLVGHTNADHAPGEMLSINISTSLKQSS